MIYLNKTAHIIRINKINKLSKAPVYILKVKLIIIVHFFLILSLLLQNNSKVNIVISTFN
jgi:hypothetical protein